MLGQQLRGTALVGFGQMQFCPGLRLVGDQPVDLGLVRTGVKLEQYLALVHQGAFLELDRLHETVDPRAHLRGVDRFHPAGEFGTVADLAGQRLRHRHLGRGTGIGALRLAVTTMQQEPAAKGGGDDQWHQQPLLFHFPLPKP